MPNWTFNTVVISGIPETLHTIRDRMETKGVDDETGKEYVQLFDFNKLIPMPESLDITSGGGMTEAIITYLTDGLRYDVGNMDPNDEKGKQLQKAWAKYAKCDSFIAPKSVQKAYEDAKERFKDPQKISQAVREGKQYIDNMDQYGCPTWYEWRSRHWGTKWNARNVEREKNDEENTLTYYFQTAWAEPEPVMRALSFEYPNVRIEHHYEHEREMFEVEHIDIYHKKED